MTTVETTVQHLRHAVTDGPSGVTEIELPANREKALQIRHDYDGRFWCTHQVGGCGGLLRVHAGAKIRPYFQHVARSGGCALATSASYAANAYRHLEYQRALVEWLEVQGYAASIEHRFGDDGRADLRVDVLGTAHSIEVQLSPMSYDLWRDRTHRYSRHVDHVTWLFGPDAEAIAARVRVAERIVWHIQRETDLGVQGPGTTRWSPLEDCVLSPDGLWSPHLAVVRSEIEEEHLRAERAHLAERGPEQDRVQPMPRDGMPEPTPYRHSGVDVPMKRRGDDRTTTSTLWNLSSMLRLFPEAEAWEPPRGRTQLDQAPLDTRPALRLFAYLAQTVYLNGPVSLFALPGALPSRDTATHLQRAGLIRLYERGQVERWARTE